MSDARAKAWETRRAKYGAKGHAGRYTRFAFDPIGRKALALIMILHDQEVLSEGQCCKALDLDRITFRIMRDGHAAARERSDTGRRRRQNDQPRDEQNPPPIKGKG